MKHLKRTIIILFAVAMIAGGGMFLYRQSQTSIVTPAPHRSEVQSQLAQPVEQTTNQPVISGEPVSLSIPSLDITLPITQGVYNAKTRQWTLTNDKVQYAVMTPQPNNQAGNTFLYGHYRKGVFATLHTIQPGAKAIITTANGKTFTYVLDTSRVVSPEDSQGIFDYQGKPILTIQTCTGVFFQNRQLFSFNLESVS
jgi:LPXTG-site transpeptidase (sortase) family protein